MYEGGGLTHARVESEMMNLGQGCSWENRFQGRKEVGKDIWDRLIFLVQFFQKGLFIATPGSSLLPKGLSLVAARKGQLSSQSVGSLIAVSSLVAEHSP